MVYSIIIYLLTFCISCSFFYLSEIIGEKKSRTRIVRKTIALLGIITPCFLAALRGHSVGIDVDLYVTPNFQYARTILKNGFAYFYENMPVPTEIGFALILYVGAVLDSLPLAFFIMQLLGIIPIYYCLRRNSEIVSVPLGMMCYFFLFYNVSLSIMRGSIAMAFLFYAINYLGRDMYVRYWLIVIAGMLFHSSIALVAIITFTIYIVLKGKRKKLVVCVLFAILLLFYLLSIRYVNVLMDIVTILNPRYSYYLSLYMGEGSYTNIPITDLFTKTIMIILIFLLMKRKHFDLLGDKKLCCLLMYVLMGRYFVLFNGVFYESLRIAYYFDVFLILLVAQLPPLYLNISNKRIIGLIVLLPAFLYWLHFIMIIGGYETNVYKFA